MRATYLKVGGEHAQWGEWSIDALNASCYSNSTGRDGSWFDATRASRSGSGQPIWLASLRCELHYIADIANVSSILDHGILSHRLVKRRIAAHVTVASVEVQAIRAVKRIWVGHSSRALHDYANLYVHARNAMLFQLVMSHEGDLIVLAVDPRVLDVEGVIVADRNAAATIAKFDPAAEGVEQLDEGQSSRPGGTTVRTPSSGAWPKCWCPTEFRRILSSLRTFQTAQPRTDCSANSAAGSFGSGSTDRCFS